MTIVDINWGMLLLGVAILAGMIAAIVVIIRYAIHLRRDIKDVKSALQDNLDKNV